ncbi:hypothetical protein Runsl_4463 [Runella slithyformis DSM 19594]|uniref:Uncharacterized protein n=1 Tax=Runella slithyformis (strain ATCC 29530 / DSM 19594 / LMG 11500 / NCIMB 11436 / LSU 4) TaxID=761193 RepID=A0A7U4E7Y0_RUNSL|nr:hypothetical protein Runsl_4463 [Runella slithyformis DSM 19594]
MQRHVTAAFLHEPKAYKGLLPATEEITKKLESYLNAK